MILIKNLWNLSTFSELKSEHSKYPSFCQVFRSKLLYKGIKYLTLFNHDNLYLYVQICGQHNVANILMMVNFSHNDNTNSHI